MKGASSCTCTGFGVTTSLGRICRASGNSPESCDDWSGATPSTEETASEKFAHGGVQPPLKNRLRQCDAAGFLIRPGPFRRGGSFCDLRGDQQAGELGGDNHISGEPHRLPRQASWSINHQWWPSGRSTKDCEACSLDDSRVFQGSSKGLQAPQRGQASPRVQRRLHAHPMSRRQAGPEACRAWDSHRPSG